MSAVYVFENIVGKEEIACNKQFLLYPQCFLFPFRELSALKLCSANSFWVWKSLKFVVWKRVNDLSQITELSKYIFSTQSKSEINPLTNNKILDWSKLKQIADNILSAYKMENKYQ